MGGPPGSPAARPERARPPAIALLAATAEHLRVLVWDPDRFEERFSFSVEEALDVFPGALASILSELERDGVDPGWHTHLFVDMGRKRVVGFGGFKGPPQGGAVEIGYAVAPAARGRGVATGAVRQLLECARRRGALLCLAHTLPERSASTTVLERCGFVMVGETVDRANGPVWRWELPLH